MQTMRPRQEERPWIQILRGCVHECRCEGRGAASIVAGTRAGVATRKQYRLPRSKECSLPWPWAALTLGPVFIMASVRTETFALRWNFESEINPLGTRRRIEELDRLRRDKGADSRRCEEVRVDASECVWRMFEDG